MDVYVEPVRTRYTANGIGAYLLLLLSYAVVVFIPLVIGFGTGQFWMTSSVIVGRPIVKYTERMVIRVETGEGNALAYISSPTAMEELEDSIAGLSGSSAPLFRAGSTNGLPTLQTMYPAVNLFKDDHDSNDIVDAFHFQIAIPMNYSQMTVARVCMLPEFYYHFDSPMPALDIVMTTAPLICVESPNPSAAFEAGRVQGELVFKASTLPESSDYVRYDRIYADSLFNSFTAMELASVVPIATAYGLRNFSLAVEERVAIVGQYSGLTMAATNIDPSSTFDQFNFEVVLKVPSTNMRYVPAWYENFKIGWIQYICIAWVVYFIVDLIKSILVKQALINTIAIWENRQRVVN